MIAKNVFYSRIFSAFLSLCTALNTLTCQKSFVIMSVGWIELSASTNKKTMIQITYTSNAGCILLPRGIGGRGCSVVPLTPGERTLV